MANITTTETEVAEERPGAVFWITAVLGAAIVVFGVRGLFENEPRGAASAVRWYIGGALVLDLIIVPLGAMAGWVGKRLVPGWAWPVVRAALLTTVVLAVFAGPLILEPQGASSNASARPRNYETGLVVAIAATWLVATAALVVRRARTTRQAA